ncbi:MAG: hypothetical protein ACI9WU_002003, partial [Myxococcota bacterium]
AVGATETIADLCREFNFQHGTTTAYKPFYMRLARRSFPKFMRAVAMRLIRQLAVRVLQPEPDSPLARFKDIVIQDGTSFALKPALSGAFPGRFKTVEPAAVEIHVTFSGFNDEVEMVHVSPDTAAERHFLPKPEDLRDKLLLADRGYPARPYFRALDAAGASFVMRLSRSWRPRVQAVYDNGRCGPVSPEVPLSQFLAQHPKCVLDLDIVMAKGRTKFAARLMVVPGKREHKHRIRLCTNLPRDAFSVGLVYHLYRFRWQLELLFKEWKSYANLRKFDTANQYIARGLIWASLAAAVLKRFIAHAADRDPAVPISTRTAAMCARVFVRPLLMSVGKPRLFRRAMAEAVQFLQANARRAHPDRDKQRGRLKAGLELCSGPKV